jgi:hypothetical protein
MFHVYHHCSGEEWEARQPELDAILASFELLDPGESEEEAVRAAAAQAAFLAAKAEGQSTEAAFEAGQAAYAAAPAAGEAPEEGAGPQGE